QNNRADGRARLPDRRQRRAGRDPGEDDRRGRHLDRRGDHADHRLRLPARGPEAHGRRRQGVTREGAMTVLYFASVKEKVGCAEEQVSPPGSVVTVSDLIDWLAARSPKHADAFANRATIKSAVDQTHVPLSAPLGNAREVAFFPPVTGG